MRRTRTMRWKGRTPTGRYAKNDIRSIFTIPMTTPSAVSDFCDKLRNVAVRVEIGVEGATDELDDNLRKWIAETYGTGRMAARYRTRKIRDRGAELQRLAEQMAKVAVKLNREFEACLAALEDDEERERAKKLAKQSKGKRTVVTAKSAFTLD